MAPNPTNNAAVVPAFLPPHPHQRIHTPAVASVPAYVKEYPGKRWWCSRPGCVASVTAPRDLHRHYRQCHSTFLDAAGQVPVAEQTSWVHARYIASGHATAAEVAAHRAAPAVVAGSDDEDNDDDETSALPAASPFVTLRSSRAAAALAVARLALAPSAVSCSDLSFSLLAKQIKHLLAEISLVFAGLAALRKHESALSPSVSFDDAVSQIADSSATIVALQGLAEELRPEEEEEDSDVEMEEVEETEEEEEEEDDDDEEMKEDSENEPVDQIDQQDWTSAQMLLHASELVFHAAELRQEGRRADSARCAAEAVEWREEGERRRGEEEAGLREAWEYGAALVRGPSQLVKRPYGA